MKNETFRRGFWLVTPLFDCCTWALLLAVPLPYFLLLFPCLISCFLLDFFVQMCYNILTWTLTGR